MSLVKNCLRPVQAIIAAGVITLLSVSNAIAYLRQGRDQEAKDRDQRALEINPGDLEIQQFLQTLP
ncbi:MAG: hypothetical protein KFF72_04315 [Arthrospira sp. SH-MAG29]|nr:hypothetical protein [Arthrospira sp. SH-MAG29]MBS0015583.1 hypothetical protein [Arthrospira sp. SH-MAG29]